jgi:hypothetical protein
MATFLKRKLISHEVLLMDALGNRSSKLLRDKPVITLVSGGNFSIDR